MSQIDSSPTERKQYRLKPDDVLRSNGIEVRDEARYYTTCPQCSAKRKTFHQKIRCLGVTRPDDERVYWGCNHCGWTGPGPQRERSRLYAKPRREAAPQAANPTGTTRTLYNYAPRLRKVKIVRPDGTKKMWWEHRTAGGFWERGVGGIDTDRLLYRIDLAIKMTGVLGLPICIVEGEKDVDALMHKGFPATCNAHGASEPGKLPKWTVRHADQLVARDLAVFNDADEAGIAHARTICELSLGRARSIVVVDQQTHFPGAKDIAAWFRAGGDAATLRDFIEGAPEYEA